MPPELNTTRTVDGIQSNASVGSDDLDAPVTVQANGYTIRFSGNGFEGKHLRRIRRDSVDQLTINRDDAARKLNDYVKEGRGAAARRWGAKMDPAASTNSLVFLTLGGYCQLGALIAGKIRQNPTGWTQFGGQDQQHVNVTLDRCLTHSSDGFGRVKNTSGSGPMQVGVGVDLKVTVQKDAANANLLTVVHLAGATVRHSFSPDTKLQGDKALGIGDGIVA